MNTKPIILTVQAFEDFRGYLAVLYDKSVDFTICQINQGYSKKAFTLRGLHFQEGEYAQAKLVSCLHGSIFNVAVDLRPGETFGHAYSAVLSFENRKQMYIPRGFAHGYLTLKDDTLMQWCVDMISAVKLPRLCGMIRILSGKVSRGLPGNTLFQKRIERQYIFLIYL